LVNYLDQNVWNDIYTQVRQSDEYGTQTACLIEILVCVCCQFWCIFCCHTCISQTYAGNKLNELLWALNNRQFSGLPVCTACEPLGVQINTEYIEQHNRQIRERMQQQGNMMPGGVYGQQQPGMYAQQQPVMYAQQQPGMYAQQPVMYAQQPPQQAQLAYAVPPSVGGMSAVPVDQQAYQVQSESQKYMMQQQPNPAATPVVASVVVPRTMEVQIPAGAAPGSILTVLDPNGNQVRLTVPEGCQPGAVVTIQY
jgi:hypothetical protein